MVFLVGLVFLNFLAKVSHWLNYGGGIPTISSGGRLDYLREHNCILLLKQDFYLEVSFCIIAESYKKEYWETIVQRPGPDIELISIFLHLQMFPLALLFFVFT